jgi:serine/threonine-protein kinase
MNLTAERWRILRAVFAELTDLEPGERQRRLSQITFNDPELKAEVAALLAAADEVGDRFERGPALGALDGAAGDEDAPVIGERIGPYRVVREIGRGGMGAVYEAHRDDDAFQKRVALKMVASGRDTDAILRRFRYERQILARLEHRNIAALLDGGLTESGQPFFAMEYVEGQRIDEFCRVNRLSVRDRLQLFRQACSAVHYAHQNLVVHRDLKPSNFLVGADGTVKLLDFGIAKLLDPESDPGDALTHPGAAPMTTAYASPEQLIGEPVTTASDIYSLGVLLYELVVGKVPFETRDLPILEARRRRLEETPVPPSRAVTAETAATRSEATARRLQRAIGGDLDNIVMMALRREPDRRYPSVEALSDDLLRFLAGLPTQATPDSLGYRFRKLVRRNRLAVAAVAAAIVAVLVGTAASLWQTKVARRERDRAEREQEKATQVTEFFREVLMAAAPQQSGRSVTVVEAIAAAIPRIDSAFADQPWVKTALKSTVGSTLYDMGLKQEAEPLLRAALGEQIALDSGRVTEDLADATYNVATVAQDFGRLEEAESLYRRAMAMYESLPEMTPAEIARGWGQVSTLMISQGRTEEALVLQGRVVDILRTRLPRTDRALWIAIANYGSALTDVGRLEEGEKHFQEAIALGEAARGRDGDDVGTMLQPLAMNLLFAGKLSAAESVARRSHRIMVQHRGASNTAALASLRAVISVLIERERCDEAIPLARGVIALRGTEIPDTDLSLGSAYLALGQCLGTSGDPVAGVAAAREGLALREALFPPDHWVIAQAKSLLGEVLLRSGSEPEGRRLLEEGYRGMVDGLGVENIRTKQAKDRVDRWAR